MICSMTGFAATQRTLSDGRSFALTVKSVNHRHLDLQLRLPNGLDALEPKLRSAVKTAVRRGHVEVVLSFGKPLATAAVEIDEAVLAAHVTQFRALAERLGLKQEPDLNELLQLPGVVGSIASMPLEPALAEPAVLSAFGELLGQFNASREAEGAVLAGELRSAMMRIAALAQQARTLREGVADAEFDRLRARIEELLAAAGAQHEIDQSRLLTEAGVLAARGDVEEELVRLAAHTRRFIELLDTGGEVGRSLDFLLQELNREANTFLSKTGGSEAGLQLTEIGLVMKVELERAREQVQNLE